MTNGPSAVIALPWAVHFGPAWPQDDPLDDRLTVRTTDRVEFLEDAVTRTRGIASVPMVYAQVTHYGRLIAMVLEAMPIGSVATVATKAACNRLDGIDSGSSIGGLGARPIVPVTERFHSGDIGGTGKSD